MGRMGLGRIRKKKHSAAAIINSGDIKPKQAATVKDIRGILAVGAAANLGGERPTRGFGWTGGERPTRLREGACGDPR